MIALRTTPEILPVNASSVGNTLLFDEICQKCTLLLGDDFADHCAAYLYLRRCRPFGRVLERLGSMRKLNLFDLAALLVPGSTRMLADVAIQFLHVELAQGVSESECMTASTMQA